MKKRMTVFIDETDTIDSDVFGRNIIQMFMILGLAPGELRRLVIEKDRRKLIFGGRNQIVGKL
jgi:hypothetical protein